MPTKPKRTNGTTRDAVLEAVNGVGLKVDKVVTTTAALDTRLARIEERVTGVKETVGQHQKDIERLEGRDTNVGLLSVVVAAVGSAIAAFVGTRN